MTTTRQIQALLSDGQHAKLIEGLAHYRSDLPAEAISALNGSPMAAAAVAAIRLQELNQQRDGVYRNLIARLIAAQESNGGWGDTLVTSLVARALLGEPSARSAAIRALILLAGLQKDDGSLPRDPVRRLPGDALTTAFALAHLARSQEFAQRFRIESAIFALTQARGTVSPAVEPLIKLVVQRASASVGGQAMRLVQLAMAS